MGRATGGVFPDGPHYCLLSGLAGLSCDWIQWLAGHLGKASRHGYRLDFDGTGLFRIPDDDRRPLTGIGNEVIPDAVSSNTEKAGSGGFWRYHADWSDATSSQS